VNDTELASFIVAQTRPSAASLVPELQLHLATEVTPLWQATEASLEQNGLPPPYWAFAWPGGQALARHILDHPELVRGRRVLDFAAGCGIAAIAAAKMEATVTASEIDRVAATAMAMNARLNQVAVTIIDHDVIAAPQVAWDVVLAGDVFYERPMTERVEPWLRGLASAGATVLVGDPGRSYLPKHGLCEVGRYIVPTSRDLEDRETRETRIYTMSG
jgi:predicted nicotinamide N-methyase